MSDIPPYSYKTGNKPDGFVIDVVGSTLSRLELTPTFRLMTYARVVASINNNTIDAATILSIDNQLIGLSDSTKCSTHPFSASPWGAYQRSDSEHTPNNNYNNLKVGSYRVVNYDHLKKVNLSSSMSNYRTNGLLFKALISKRIDIAIFDQITAVYLSNKTKFNIKKVEDFGIVDMRICFSEHFMSKIKKNKPNYMKMYSQETLNIIQNGTVSKILTKRGSTWLSEMTVHHIK